MLETCRATRCMLNNACICRVNRYFSTVWDVSSVTYLQTGRPGQFERR